MPRDVVKEVFGDLLSSTDSGYTLPYIPLSSPPDQKEEPQLRNIDIGGHPIYCKLIFRLWLF
jgi:hypothetical protein